MNEYRSPFGTDLIPGRSVSEIHSHFDDARQALVALPGGYDVKMREQMHSKCSLFATRVTRVAAVSVVEVLHKIDAAEWLEHDPRQTLAAIRHDLFRINKSDGGS